MGACYSKKASGGNRSYSTVQMASTKLDEASRLARPTPYSRAIGSPNANIDYGVKKNIPLSTIYQNAPNSNVQSEIKNIKNSFQSNIPRFSSSLPATTTSIGDQKTANCNENETLHVVNNNAIASSRSTSNITNALPVSITRQFTKVPDKPKSITSKSCPDNIVSQEKIEEKSMASRIPGKGSGLPRQMGARSAHSISHMNVDTMAVPKQQSKESHRVTSTKSNQGSQEFTKSPSKNGFDSRDSLSDFDSGFGNSLTDKSKPEDSDTIKDLERLELQEEPSLGMNTDTCHVRVTPKSSRAEEKIMLKPPMYKREPNGKWSFDEKNFKADSEFSSPGSENSVVLVSGNSPKEKHSYKMNASENIFSTYASYKGLLSYKKKSFKPIENTVVNSPRDKLNSAEKISKSSQSNLSCIPKIRKPVNRSPSSGVSVFYVENFSEPKVETEKFTLNTVEKTQYKPELDSKHSSLDSDDKSDSTENGVLSPTSEVENREFLIDDEISDQPGLISFATSKSDESEVQSLQQTVTELHALQLASSSKRRTDSVGSYSSRRDRSSIDHRDSLILGSDLGSSCSSIASDDLMLDYEKTFDNFPEGTVNEGPASPVKKLPDVSDVEDKVTPLRAEKKIDFDEKNRKWLHRRSSGPFVGGANKPEWRLRTVSLPLRPPRPMTVSESDDGSLKLDSSSYRLLCQDLNGVKTLLLRLKTVIQEAETINPFDQANPKNIFYHSLVHNDFPAGLVSLQQEKDCEKEGSNFATASEENADLRRQVVLLQQQLEEKDHTIHLLQQQMTKYFNFHGISDGKLCTLNAATQTERVRSLNGSLSGSLSSSADDSSETLVSVQDAFEEFFSQNSLEQDRLKEHLKEVTCSLSSLNHSLHQSAQKNPPISDATSTFSKHCTGEDTS